MGFTSKSQRNQGIPRLNLLVLEDRTVPAATGFSDFGFESPALAAGTFQYRPTGSAWTFSGGAGLSANQSAFTIGNPTAVQGSQVAFLQGKGAVTQKVTLAAGTYTLSFAAAQRGSQASAQTLQVLVDGNVVTSFNNLTGKAYSNLTTSTFTVSAGEHTITIQATNLRGGDNTALIDQITLSQQATGLNDSGFEIPLQTSGFKYRPTGSAWTFAGGAGIAQNKSAFTSGNPSAPQGSQVVFLQGQGSISQQVTFGAGTYTISFSAAQRGNQASAQTFQVLVDGNVVSTFNNVSGAGYINLTTSSFKVTAGNHTVKIQATNLRGGDNTILIDQVSIAQQATSLNDSGFEGVVVPGGGFDHAPAGGAWTFGGGGGISANGSGFTSGNPSAPQGSQVVFLQGKGSISQAITFANGNYSISFLAAQRGNLRSAQTFDVLIDGNVVGTFNTLMGAAYQRVTTSSFAASAGSHVLTIQATNLNGGDNTVLIDQIEINQVATTLGDPGFESAGLGSTGYVYSPTGTAWNFVGEAGVTGNGTAFTNRNPNAPQGSQVAFLQRNGSMSQTMSFAAGTYTISFSAAQRANIGAVQTLLVLVDGYVVGAFNNLANTSYTTLTTSSFTIGAGSHVVTFKGTNLYGGPNTIFIDQVAVNRQPTGLADSGFEAAALAPNQYGYRPSGTAWTFSGPAGVSNNGSAFTIGNPKAPQGSQVMFLQGKSSARQTVSFAAGTYNLSFLAAQRGSQTSNQTFQVLIDGTVVGTFNSLKGAAYSSLTTSDFTVTDGNHLVVFQTTNLNPGDNAVLIDMVAINPV